LLPGRDEPVEVLRARHPDPALGGLTLRAVVDHVDAAIRGLDLQPVLVGHSMGGLVVQLLAQRGLGAAVVAIDSAPPEGVFTVSWPFLKSNWAHINPFAKGSGPIEMTFSRFQYTFVHTLPLEQQRAAYDRYVVPESRLVPAESLTGAARVHFARPHPPLLLVAGGADHIIPAALNRKNYRRYAKSPSPVDFKEFPGRVHFTIGQDGWEEVADAVADWLAARGL
jgi:pimeloyl-ACP methyl ester carboxylesterase